MSVRDNICIFLLLPNINGLDRFQKLAWVFKKLFFIKIFSFFSIGVNRFFLTLLLKTLIPKKKLGNLTKKQWQFQCSCNTMPDKKNIFKKFIVLELWLTFFFKITQYFQKKKMIQWLESSPSTKMCNKGRFFFPIFFMEQIDEKK